MSEHKPVAWRDDGSTRMGSDGSGYRVVTDETKASMPNASAVNFTDALYPASYVSTLEARLEKAREVIEPFAERAGMLDGIWQEHETHWSPAYGSTTITIGQLRAARAWMERNDE